MSALAALIAGSVARIALAGGPSGVWERIGDPPNAAPFINHAAVFDSAGDRVLVYNPVRYVAGNPTSVAEIWEFRCAQPDSGWRMWASSGELPRGRTGASLALDASHGRLFLFGGFPLSEPIANTLWLVSLAEPHVWSIVPAITDTLSPRFGSVLQIDPQANQLVLYGGRALVNGLYRAVGDAWALPLDGPQIWSPLLPSGTPPRPRNTPQAAWDPARRRMLMHGGAFDFAPTSATDTWALSFAPELRWDSLATTGPQFRRYTGGAVVDGPRSRFVVAPGSSGVFPVPAADRQVYALPLAPDGEWATVTGGDSIKPTVALTVVAHDTRRDRMLHITSHELHAYALADSSGWRRLWPPAPPREPPSLSNQVLVADAANERIWSVGGEACCDEPLWSLDPAGAAHWTYVPGVALPLLGFAAALDPARGRIVVVDLYSPPARRVTTFAVDGPPLPQVFTPLDTMQAFRQDFSAAIDSARDRLLLFGGQYFGPHFGGHSFDDSWAMSLADPRVWAEVVTTGPRPSARGSHFAFVDDLRNRMVVLGGWQQSGGPIRRTQHSVWALSLAGTTAWAMLDSTAWDLPLDGRITYDAQHHRLYLFHAADRGSPAVTQVWTRGTADTDTWQLLTTAGDAPVADAPIALAAWSDRLVVATTTRDGPQRDETWALTLDHAVAALASLESVEASAVRVRLAWRLSGSSGAPVELDRRIATEPWQSLGMLYADGEGRVTYDDGNVQAGTAMRYRLSQSGTTLIETDVRIPVAATFAFAGARPSPAVGEIAVAFTLPAASPITLELFDLRGARVRHHVFGSMAAGSHVVAWPSTAALAPGLYVARLSSAAGAREARVVKVR